MNVNEGIARALALVMGRGRRGGSIQDRCRINGVVHACLIDAKTGKKRYYKTKNIVTNDGDLFYAERAVKTAIPSNFVDGSGDFDGIMELYNGASAAPAKTNIRSNLAGLVGSGKAMDSGYPKINDDDTDNPGRAADIITYRVSFLTSEVNGANIDDVIITNPSPAAGEVLLMHAEFAAPFTKTSSDTLKVWVNHEPLGV